MFLSPFAASNVLIWMLQWCRPFLLDELCQVALNSGNMSMQQLQMICLTFAYPLSLDFLTLCPFFPQTFSFALIFCSFFNYLLCTPIAPAPICVLFFYLCSVSPSSPRHHSPCSGVLALVPVKAALPLKTVCLNEKGAGGRTRAESHSWSQLRPFPVWGAAGWGQPQGHSGPSLRLGPGAGSELPSACVCACMRVYITACVFLCELREKGQKAHLFLIPHKASLSGPGGAGVPVEDWEGGEKRASERSHAHSMCRARRGAMWPLIPPPPTSFHLFHIYIFSSDLK